MKRVLPFLLVCWLAPLGAEPAGVSGAAPSATNESGSTANMVIATRQAPPFAYQEADGRWAGIAIELWERIAAQNGYDYQYRELGLTEMLDAVAARRVDAAVAALTITGEREQRFDFSHGFHTTGLAIAVPVRNANLLSALGRFMSPQFLGIVAALLALLIVIGVLIWLAERRANAQFQREPLAGISAGLWWSAVTLTTVGYGDKAPVTVLGRVLAMLWMFAGLILISAFTAAITTALTVSELDAAIDGIEDLRFKRVLALADSTSDRFLAAEGIRHRTVGDLTEALRKLADGEADAVVHDAPILRHQVSEAFAQRLRVLPFTLTRQVYGIALPGGSRIREPVNVALLGVIGSSEWPEILTDYLGTDG